MPIGSQGCSYIHAIVITGEQAGRVLNMDMSIECPQFAAEANFLDWYERWLDEVIDETLVTTEPTWFGYGPAGKAAQ